MIAPLPDRDAAARRADAGDGLPGDAGPGPGDRARSLDADEVTDAGAEVPDARAEVPDVGAEVPDARAEVPDARAEVPDVRAEVADAGARAQAPTPRRDPTAGWLYRVAAAIAFAVMRLQAWRYDVRGLQHVPRHGGAVLTANHTSFWDYFTVGRAPYRRWDRPVRILAKESLFRAPGFGPIIRRTGHIPVHRGSGARALSSAISALRRGELVLVLPEQTISPSFELIGFKSGAPRMAAQAGVPLVPTVSWGSHRFHTTGRRPRWSWRLPVTVIYGEPLHPSPDDDPVEVTEELRRRTAALLDEAQRTYRDGAPAGAWWVPARLGGGAPTRAEADLHVQRLAARWAQAAAARAGQARDRVQEGAEHARERVQEGAEHARERVQEGAEHARERVQEGAERAREGAEQARHRVQEGAEHARERVQEGAEQARHRVQEGAEHARSRAREGAEHTRQRVQEGVEQARQRVQPTDAPAGDPREPGAPPEPGPPPAPHPTDRA